MITKLTKEQESRFHEFFTKWTAIGLSTEKLNRESIKLALATAFQQVGKPSPKLVICTSPLAACLTRAILASVRDSVRASVRASVLASVRDSVSASVSDSVRDSVSDSVLDSVRDSVRDSVSASVSAWYYRDFGQYAAWWLSFYDFMATVLAVDNSPLKGNEMLCSEAGFSLLFWELALVSEKPTAIHRNEQGRLHKDGGPALVHSDGFGVWALNGLRMKPEYIETPAERLAPETVLAETNVDIRRELLRKVGIERMLAKLPHRSLHKRGNYEVLSIRLSEEVTDARYLRMENPSVKCFHLEGIEPGLKTVEEALAWRNQNWHTDAEILT